MDQLLLTRCVVNMCPSVLLIFFLVPVISGSGISNNNAVPFNSTGATPFNSTGATPFNHTANNCTKDQMYDIVGATNRLTWCFDRFARIQLNGTLSVSDTPGSITPCNNIQDLKNHITAVFKARSVCISKEAVKKGNLTEKFFIELVEYTFQNNSYKNFINDNGLVCVNENRHVIRQCLRNGTGLGSNHTKYIWDFQDMGKLSLLNNSNGCGDANNVKMCVEKELKKSHNCTENNIKFASGMFDFSAKELCKERPAPRKAEINTTTITVASITSVVAVVCIIGAVVVWRSSRKNSYST